MNGYFILVNEIDLSKMFASAKVKIKPISSEDDLFFNMILHCDNISTSQDTEYYCASDFSIRLNIMIDSPDLRQTLPHKIFNAIGNSLCAMSYKNSISRLSTGYYPHTLTGLIRVEKDILKSFSSVLTKSILQVMSENNFKQLDKDLIAYT
jgi:hypothetical protein